MLDIKNCKKEFDKYTKDYDFKNHRINLKYHHTLRVVDNCEKIAKSLSLNNKDINLARIIGFLHDIGRFEQIKQYNSFNDIKTIDHAELGVKILKENNYLNKYTAENHKIILEAISNHNKFSIKLGLDKRTEMFCKIIRDADKIDIIEILFNDNVKIITNAGEINEKILKSIEQNNLADKKDSESKMDNYLCIIAFIFDLYFVYSLDYLKESKIIEKIIEKIITKNRDKEIKLIQVKKIVKDFLNK